MGKQQRGGFKRVTITLPLELLEAYQRFCEKEGMNLSSRIAVLIKKDLEK